jgi:hypothetical protein
MKIFFTLLFFILFSPIWGQKFSYKWAENDLDKKESIRPDFVFTKKDGNFIVVSLKVNADAGKQKIAINEYNGALKKVKSVSDVRFKNKAGEDIDIYQSMSIKGNHYLLGNKYDSKSNVFKLYAFQLDNNLKSSGNPIELLTFFADKERKIPKLSFRFSPDKSKLLVYADLFNKKKEKDEYRMIVFDQNLGILWDKKITMPYNRKDMIVTAVEINNKSEVFVQYFHIVKKESDFKLLVVQNGGEEMHSIDLDKNGKYFTAINSRIGSNGDIIFFGLYCNKKSRNFHNGFCTITLDYNSNEILSSNFKEFDEALLRNFFKDKKAKRLAKQETGLLTDYKLQNIYPDSKGGFIVLFEDKKVVENIYVSSSGYVKSTTKHDYKDLVTLSFDENYNLKNAETVYKSLMIGYNNNRAAPGSSLGDLFSGNAMSLQTYIERFIETSTFFYNDKLYHLFNDHHKNEDKERYKDKSKVKTTRKLKKANSILAWVENGEIQREQVVNGKEEDLVLNTQLATVVDGNKILLYCSNFATSKREKLGLLIFDEGNPIVKKIPFNEQFDKKEGMAKSVAKASPAVPKTEVSNEEAEASNSFFDRKPDIYSKDVLNFYTVEVKSSSTPLSKNDALYSDFSQLYEFKSNGMYYYYVGKYKSEEIAQKFQEFLKKNNIESQVVEYKLGRRIEPE